MKLPPCAQTDIRKPSQHLVPREIVNKPERKPEVVLPSRWVYDLPTFPKLLQKAPVQSKVFRELSKAELAERAWAESMKKSSGDADAAIKEFIAKHFGGGK